MSAISASSPVPLYHQIATEMRRRIVEGDYPVGATLPTEEDLGREFGVSRATIRQALAHLVDAGAISRRRGRGTTVLPAATRSLGQRFRGSLADLMAETRRAGVRDVTIDRAVAVPPRVAALLQLPVPTGTVVRRTRTMDDAVFAVIVNYLPDEVGALLSEMELRQHSLMWLLETKGIGLSEATQSIRAQLADQDLSQRLDMPFGGAVLFVERLVLGGDEVPVELVQTWYRGDLYEYTVTFDLDRAARDDIHGKLA